jgi:hypothetical protein
MAKKQRLRNNDSKEVYGAGGVTVVCPINPS